MTRASPNPYSFCARLLRAFVSAGGLAARPLRRLALAGGVEPRDPEERGVRRDCEGVQDKGRRAGGCRRGPRVQDHGRFVEGEPQASRTTFCFLTSLRTGPAYLGDKLLGIIVG